MNRIKDHMICLLVVVFVLGISKFDVVLVMLQVGRSLAQRAMEDQEGSCFFRGMGLVKFLLIHFLSTRSLLQL